MCALENIIVASPTTLDLEAMCRSIAGAFDRVMIESSGSLYVEERNEVVRILEDSTIAGEYEDYPEEIQIIQAAIPEPVFYNVMFRGYGLVKRVVPFVANAPGLVVDTTHGVVLGGQDFVRKLRESPEWDWRVDGQAR